MGLSRDYLDLRWKRLIFQIELGRQKINCKVNNESLAKRTPAGVVFNRRLGSFRLLLFVRKNLRLSTGKDQRQFVREPFAVVQNFGSVLFLFFPMVGEFHRAPVGNVTIFPPNTPSSIPIGGEQSDMPAMQGLSGPTSIPTIRWPVNAN